MWMEQSFSNSVVKVFKPVVDFITTMATLTVLTILVQDFKAIVDYLHSLLHPYFTPELVVINFRIKLVFQVTAIPFLSGWLLF